MVYNVHLCLYGDSMFKNKTNFAEVAVNTIQWEVYDTVFFI